MLKSRGPNKERGRNMPKRTNYKALKYNERSLELQWIFHLGQELSFADLGSDLSEYKVIYFFYPRRYGTGFRGHFKVYVGDQGELKYINGQREKIYSARGYLMIRGIM